MKFTRLFTFATIAFAIIVSAQDIPNLDDLIGGGSSQDIVSGSLDSTTSAADITSVDATTSSDAATTDTSATDASTTADAVATNNMQVTNTDGGAILAPSSTTNAEVTTTTTTSDTYSTPTTGLTPDEKSDLECESFVDDFSAFDCKDVDASSVNTNDFDCVDDLIEPNLQCFNVDGSSIDSETPTSGGNLLDDLVDGSTPSAEANADTSANGNVDNTAGNLVQAAGSRMYTSLFSFSNMFGDSTIIGIALAAGAAFVF
ncbi:hypothetical protein HK096_004451 [Nowakowskiella sp. JEL0078]|nr:hypothetical protein HK096_004451 [Nowakowskiella sp. JEL0078]